MAEYELTACHGKAAFISICLARKAAARRKGRNVYRCKSCGNWHVGSTDFDKKRAARLRRNELRQRGAIDYYG